ncbi:uncharacterized protein METZ01_LOCUS291038, partial [marine metagenome]
MASVRQISRRIRSVQNTAKITKAMAMIAASKLRRSQDAATQGRYYANSMKEMVSNVTSQIGDEIANQPLAKHRDIKSIGVLFITSDRGLTGGLNSNLMRALDDFIVKQDVPVKIIGVGKKGIAYSRRNNLELLGDFSGIGDRPQSKDTIKVANLLIDKFNAGNVDSFFVGYSQF